MTKAMTEINNQMFVVTVIASLGEHIRICLLQGQILLCRNTHLIPCFQPEVHVTELSLNRQKEPLDICRN